MTDNTPSLYESARRLGVPFASEAAAADEYVHANGLRLHHLEWGPRDAPDVLMLHGFAQTCHMWDFSALSLADRYRVVALDQRGHGDSDWAPDGDYGLDAHQRDIAGLVDAVALENFVLVGLSMGARNAVAYAAAHPEQVDALVVVDWSPEPRGTGAQNIARFIEDPDELDSFEEFVERVSRYSHRRPLDQIRAGLVHNVKQLSSGKWTWKYDPALRSPSRHQSPEQDQTKSLWSTVDAVRCPTLLVRGADSDVLAHDTAVQIRDRIPDAALTEIPEAGHRVPGDNPVAFQAALDAFLAGLT